MHYHEIRTLEQTVNTRGSKLWVQMNDNSKSSKNRHNFCQSHGGFFKRDGKWWKWVPPEDEKNGYWLKRVDNGERVFFENMTEFGKEHGLTAVKICELLNGKRKTYKGWTAVEIRQVKDGEGSYTKIKKEQPKKIGITKQVVFQDITTNQIYVVDNVNKFAKENNLDPKALYKVGRGKAKSHKNLILFNPFKNTGDLNSDK